MQKSQVAIDDVLGDSAKRKYALHAPSDQELKVTCKNAQSTKTEIRSAVECTIQNSSGKPQACILYRGEKDLCRPYYFGNAAYYGGINGTRAADYYKSLEIGPSDETKTTAYSLGFLSTGTKEYLACFVFMIPARSSSFAILEGGISDCSRLQDVHAYLVRIAEIATFKQFFSEIAVRRYTAVSGYTVPPQRSLFRKGRGTRGPGGKYSDK